MKYLLYIIAGALLMSCSSGGEAGHQEEEHHHEGLVEFTPEQFRRAGIEFGKIEIKNMSAVIPVSGMLDVPPQNLVSISAVMGGSIKSTNLLQGMPVKKGQVIATIVNPDFIRIQREYLETKSKLEYVRLEYKRQEELSKENIAATKTFQQVSSEYMGLQVALSALEQQLQLLNINPGSLSQNNIRSVATIHAPIDGYVTEVNVNIGKYVNPQDVICEIVDTRDLHAELTVFEKDITKVKKGQKIRFVLVNESTKERTGTIYLVDHKISSERTIRIHAHIDKDDPELIPNMYLKALIEADNIQSTALPDAAVVNSGGVDYIFVKGKHEEEEKEKVKEKEKEKEIVFQAVEVKKGISQNGYTEVILPGGFDVAGTEVVVKGAYDILSKMNVSEEEGHAH